MYSWQQMPLPSNDLANAEVPKGETMTGDAVDTAQRQREVVDRNTVDRDAVDTAHRQREVVDREAVGEAPVPIAIRREISATAFENAVAKLKPHDKEEKCKLPANELSRWRWSGGRSEFCGGQRMFRRIDQGMRHGTWLFHKTRRDHRDYVGGADHFGSVSREPAKGEAK